MTSETAPAARGGRRWRVAVDAFGGDSAPEVPVAAAIRALREHSDLEVLLVGPEAAVRSELRRQHVGVPPQHLELVDAPTVIGMEEHAASAVRAKPDSSLVRCAALVKQGQADAAFTLGHSGAAMAAAIFTLGRVPGALRPALCVPLPSETAVGHCCLLDVGANLECEPRHLLQFAAMGVVYMRTIWGVAEPRVALLSIGEEEVKGTPLVLAAAELLRASGLNFVGNVEGRQIPSGAADVVVCDGFTGNVALKVAEGVGEFLFARLRAAAHSSLRARLGGLALRPALRAVYATVDAGAVGGSPLLGVAGASVVGHGRFDARAMANGLRVAVRAAEADLAGATARLLAQVDGGPRHPETRRPAAKPAVAAGRN